MDNPLSDDDIDADMKGIQSEFIRRKQARLLDYAIAGRWDTVESLYQEDSSVRSAKLRISEDTVLHMAVSDRREDVVIKLLGFMRDDDEMKEILELRNAKGDTPLHLAAARGMVKTCELMTEKHPDLIKFRNHEGENPLFVAAFHGTKVVFRLLYGKLQSSILEVCRVSGRDFTAADSEFAVHLGRNDGKTILHCTILKEYFDLAIQIIQWQPYLVERRDEKGYLALHYLAEKPFAFRSGTSLGVVETIIYNCVWFDPLENKDSRKLDGGRAPDNYKTCLDFLLLVVQPLMLFVSRFKCWLQSATGDMHKENLQSGISVHEESGPSTSLDIQSSCKQPQSNGEDHHATVTPFKSLKYCIWFLLKYLFIIIVQFKCINVIIVKKQKNKLACRTVDKLLQNINPWAYDNDGINPKDTICEVDSHLGEEWMKPQEHVGEAIEGTGQLNMTPFLLAVENGVIEMVKRILYRVPMAIYDQKQSDKKNALLLAVQKRQIDVYDFLRNEFGSLSEILGKVDKNGDNALHIAASTAKQGPHLIPGDTIRMLWETKWYQYVKDSMPGYFFETPNKSGKTPQEVFTDTLERLVLVNKDSDQWVEATYGACLVVAGLIATVAFPSVTTVPGDYASDGVPTLRRHDAFHVYIFSSFLALCFSLTSIVTFLNILISGFQKSYYSKSPGHRLLVGLTSLYLSLGSMLVSFFAGHVLIPKGKTVHSCLPIYAVGLLPVIIITVMEFNLYFNLLHSVLGRRPQPSYKGFSL
ncbi:hypothetical protein AAC387_Pa07g2305 [Persea americana]